MRRAIFLVALLTLCVPCAQAQSNVIVINTNDSGPGCLRDAITNANASPGTTVSFNIPTSDPGYVGGVFTIKPTSALPYITANGTVIDGSTQTAFTGDTNTSGPEVVVDGSGAGASTNGLMIRAGNCAVKNLVVSGFSGDGVWITGNAATSSVVRGCYIGTNYNGRSALRNSLDGIRIDGDASSNTIGGLEQGAGNVISGNSGSGLLIIGTNTSNNTVAGNRIGTNAEGSAALPNQNHGLLLHSGTSNNTIGGTTPAARNIISGNRMSGLWFDVAGTAGNTIQGNYIGVDAVGTAAIPNAWAGITFWGGTSGNTVGGTPPGAANVISGNTQHGIDISGAGTTGNIIQGNRIGTNVTGTAAIGNGYCGVLIEGQAASNTVGGSVSGSGNVISGNSVTGVGITGAAHHNLVVGNRIGTNAAGTAPVPNSVDGVGISGQSVGNVVGGTSAAERNILSGNLGNGVAIANTGSTGNAVLGNYIGTSVSGSAAVANLWQGVCIYGGAAGNTIGGTAFGARNIISGNHGSGIWCKDAGTTDNVIQGNYVGTNAAGDAAMSNWAKGVAIDTGALRTVVGGTTAGAGNTISGNLADGIFQQSASSSAIHGNKIGTDATGMLALPNGGCGIRLSGAGVSAIGLPNAGNLISGNTGTGLSLTNSSATNNVQGNVIGLNAAGSALPNGGHGVEINRSATNRIGGTGAGVGNVISRNALNGVYLTNTGCIANRVDGNCIGTSADGSEALGNLGCGVFIDGPVASQVGTTAPNKIAHNGSDGIKVQGTSSNRNRISVNSVYGNAGLGINLVGGTEDSYGVTANHTGTATGPNNLQNYPVISSVAVEADSLVVGGSLTALPSAVYTLEFFASSEADPSGHGEGQIYLGNGSVTTSSTGEASFSVHLTTLPPAGSYITATATDSNANTSEFSLAVRDSRALAFTNIDAGLPGAWGSSLMWGDYDNDGRLDLGVSGVVSYPEWSDYYCETRVFHNEYGAFVDRQTNWIAGGWNSSLEWGDYNNDGYLDLATAGYDDASIYRNDTAGGFVSVPAYLTPVDGCASRAVSWGDYDNDGDLDLAITGVSDTGPSTSVYRNCGNGHFADIEAGIVGLTGGPALAWVDYDVDGDLDLAVAGRDSNENLVTKLYRNDAGVFVDVKAPFVGVCSACMSWADYDNDGYPDLALTGVTSLTGNVQATTRIYDNSGSGTFTDISVAMPGLWDGACAWGDFDNDGDMDLAIAGLDPLAYEDISRVYCYDGGTFRDIHAVLIAVNDCGISWGDYDNDGDLDLAISGTDIQDEMHTSVYRNSSSVGNNAPSSPAGLNAVTGSPGEVAFSWQLASDDHTPAVGLTYSLRVGTAPGKDDVFSSMSDPVTGFRRIQTAGNCGAMLSHALTNLLTGTYYWSVQAVDSAFAGSAWAPEQTLSITGNVAVGGMVQNPYGVPIRDVPVTASGSSPTAFTTYDDGNYELRIPSGWTGTVAPGITDWAFDPPSKSFTSLSDARTTQDFVAHPPFADIGIDIADTYADGASWGDYDADGLMDVALGNYYYNGVRVAHHNADGTFSTIVLSSDSNCSPGAWLDWDGDGDLDLSAYVSENVVVFRNDAGAFAKVTLPIPRLTSACGVPCWVDLDNDGRLDLALSGWWRDVNAYAFRIFRNGSSGAFSEIPCSLPGLAYGEIAATDYDGDADVDLAVGGQYYDSVARRWHSSLNIYRNDGDWRLVDSGAVLTGLYDPCLRWGDFDNDGRPDLAAAGKDVNYEPDTRIYRNTAGGFVDSGLAPNHQAEVASWGDYDNDGRLDLMLAGWASDRSIADVYHNDGTAFTATNAGLWGRYVDGLSWVDFDRDGRLDAPLLSDGYPRLFRNESGPANTAPSAPAGLSAAFVSGNLTIAWNTASDVQTPASALTYNLRVGTTPGGNDIVSGCSAASGARLIPAGGNLGHTLSWTLRRVLPGTYYVGIQAVDGAFSGSTWANYTVGVQGSDVRSIRGQLEDSFVAVASLPVTAVFGDDFYVESPDRVSGIRVTRAGHGLAVGDRASATGLVAIDSNHEVYIAADLVGKTGSLFVSPLGLTCKSLGGGASGLQVGVEGGRGLNTIGLLVSVAGRCDYIDAHNVLLDDGSGVRVRCILPDGVPAQSDWGPIVVTGICSCEVINGRVERVLRIRDAEDITLQSGG